MTRDECERKLLDLMEQAAAIYGEYNPDGHSLYLSKHGDYFSIYDMIVDPKDHKTVHHTIDVGKDGSGKYYSLPLPH